MILQRSLLILSLVSLFCMSSMAGLLEELKNQKEVREPAQQLSFNRVLQFVQQGNHEAASIALFRLVQTRSGAERSRMQYFLGLAFLELELNQVAAYQFVEVIRRGDSEFMTKSLEKLALVADQLGEPGLINYALGQYRNRRFPVSQSDMLFFRQGEIFMAEGDYRQAARRFARVRPESRYYLKAKYNQGLANAHLGKTGSALKAFRFMSQHIGRTSKKAKKPEEKILAYLSRARVYYQRKMWAKSIRWYRRVPKDSKYWYEALFEQTWAYLMSGQFRSALSNFQTLNSPFYENKFNPEALLLQGILYLYICDYDEVKKTTKKFSRTYRPIRSSLQKMADRTSSASEYFYLFNEYVISKSAGKKYNGEIPLKVAEHLSNNEGLRKNYLYLNRLEGQKAKMKSYSSTWQRSAVAGYARRALARRITQVENGIGQFIQNEVADVLVSLKGFFDQNAFLKFEVTNEKKKRLRNKIAGKDVPANTNDENSRSRSFYVTNGYEYWPTEGERWLDELGNYHFLGSRSCRR